jgi:hypothetical protein
VAAFKFLLDNDVRHLASCFPEKQTCQLGDAGLDSDVSDDAIVAAASERNYIIVTNNRRHFERAVKQRIAASKKKDMGCTQVHGLIIVLPSLKLKQEHAIRRTSKQLLIRP